MSRSALPLLALALALGGGAAWADVVAVVSARNPAAAMSKNQVMDVFLGRASRFPDGSPAVPIDQVEGSPARDEFYLTFADRTAAQIKAHWSKIIFTGRGQPPRQATNDVEVRKLVAESPNAIGYLERNLVDGSVRVLLAP